MVGGEVTVEIKLALKDITGTSLGNGSYGFVTEKITAIRERNITIKQQLF